MTIFHKKWYLRSVNITIPQTSDSFQNEEQNFILPCTWPELCSWNKPTWSHLQISLGRKPNSFWVLLPTTFRLNILKVFMDPIRRIFCSDFFSFHYLGLTSKISDKQNCIPAGCVPITRWPQLGVSRDGGVDAWSEGGGGGCLIRGVWMPGQRGCGCLVRGVCGIDGASIPHLSL